MRHHRYCSAAFAVLLMAATGCSDNASESNNNTGNSNANSNVPYQDVGLDWPAEPTEHSWDGVCTLAASDFPLAGLYDDIYSDGHEVEGEPSPILPPGVWDWEEVHLLASWRGFSSALGTFDRLVDSGDNHFGWRLMRNDPAANADAVLQIFEGSAGMDIIDLGPEGSYASAGNPLYGDPVHFGDGPDMLRYRTGHSAAARLGSSHRGNRCDNDLAVLGSSGSLAAGSYDIITTGIHTGPGNDLVFVNNFERAAVDLGNGDDGRTDTLDPQDGRDIVVIGGNARDFRVFGGRGSDLFVWLLDEVNQEPNTWLGPNFFGGGGWGDALWQDPGTDRLVLGVPTDTPLVHSSSDLAPGTLLVMVESDYETVIDTPTQDSPYGRYYVYAPPGPDGQRTMTLQYISADESINSAYFYITAVNELQVGLGEDATVYSLDDVAGTATPDSTLEPLTAPPSRTYYEQLIEGFPR